MNNIVSTVLIILLGLAALAMAADMLLPEVDTGLDEITIDFNDANAWAENITKILEENERMKYIEFCLDKATREVYGDEGLTAMCDITIEGECEEVQYKGDLHHYKYIECTDNFRRWDGR